MGANSGLVIRLPLVVRAAGPILSFGSTTSAEAPEKQPEEEKEPAPPREKTAEEIAREEEEAKIAAFKTLAEFRAQQKVRIRFLTSTKKMSDSKS